MKGRRHRHAATNPANRPMSEAARPAPRRSARWKAGEPTTTATRNSAAAKITAVKGVTSYGNSGKGFGRGGSRPNMDNMAK